MQQDRHIQLNITVNGFNVKTFTDDDIEAVRRSLTPPPPPKKKSANYPIFQ